MICKVTCAFCGANDPKLQLFFSGRPRARLLGTSTPFVCAACVTQASQTEAPLCLVQDCTFCGQQTAPVLVTEAAILCLDCASYCASVVSLGL